MNISSTLLSPSLSLDCLRCDLRASTRQRQDANVTRALGHSQPLLSLSHFNWITYGEGGSNGNVPYPGSVEVNRACPELSSSYRNIGTLMM